MKRACLAPLVLAVFLAVPAGAEPFAGSELLVGRGVKQPAGAKVFGIGINASVSPMDALLGSALGLFVSAFAVTEFQAVQFMPAFVLPQFLLCGLFGPRDELPEGLRQFSDLLPLSYAVDAMTTITTKADATGDVLLDMLVVLGFVVAGVVLGAATLRRRTP